MASDRRSARVKLLDRIELWSGISATLLVSGPATSLKVSCVVARGLASAGRPGISRGTTNASSSLTARFSGCVLDLDRAFNLRSPTDLIRRFRVGGYLMKIEIALLVGVLAPKPAVMPVAEAANM